MQLPNGNVHNSFLVETRTGEEHKDEAEPHLVAISMVHQGFSPTQPFGWVGMSRRREIRFTILLTPSFCGVSR